MIKLKQSKQLSKVEESSQGINDLIEPNICVNEDVCSEVENEKSCQLVDSYLSLA